MTTLMIVDGYREGESRSQVIARRIKGEIAQNGLSMNRAAGLVGMTQSKFSRRMTGNVDFGIQELDHICDALGISFEYVTSGIRAVPNGDGPDGGIVRPKGFEPLTFCAGVDAESVDGEVIWVDFGNEDDDGLDKAS